MDHTLNTHIEAVRQSRKPLLLEVMTYRLDSHTTNDDALLYRSLDDIESDTSNYPLSQFEARLLDEQHLTSHQMTVLKSKATAVVDTAAEDFLKISPQSQNDLRDYLYASTR